MAFTCFYPWFPIVFLRVFASWREKLIIKGCNHEQTYSSEDAANCADARYEVSKIAETNGRNTGSRKGAKAQRRKGKELGF